MKNGNFSDNYITMVVEACQIQALAPKPAAPGNFYYCPRSLDVWTPPDYPHGGRDMHESVDRWIPLFHQLAAMVGSIDDFGDAVFEARANHDGGGHADGYLKREARAQGIEDWHELALIVVMRERFGKRWNRTFWEVIR